MKLHHLVVENSAAVDCHDADGSQVGIVLAQQTLPQFASTQGAQLLLEPCRTTLMTTYERVHQEEVLVVVLLHQKAEHLVVLGYHVVAYSVDVNA